MNENTEIFKEESHESTSLSQIVKAEIDIQIATAKKYPRSIKAFRQEALSMATSDAEIAGSCFYKLKREAKNGSVSFIEGPSVRLAEIIASSWGNLRFGARIIDESEKFVTAQGVAHDLEKNVFNSIEVVRRITTKKGFRFSDDMIGVTKNAACSIALRNAIFKTVPFAYAKQIYEEAKKTAVGSARTLNERKQQMVEAFSKMRVTEEQILSVVEKPSIEDIGLSDIETMIGIHNAIRDGETSIEEQFNKKGDKADVAPPQSKSAAEKEPVDPVLSAFGIMINDFALAKESLGKKKYHEILGAGGHEHANEIKNIKEGNGILKEMRDAAAEKHK